MPSNQLKVISFILLFEYLFSLYTFYWHFFAWCCFHLLGTYVCVSLSLHKRFAYSLPIHPVFMSFFAQCFQLLTPNFRRNAAHLHSIHHPPTIPTLSGTSLSLNYFKHYLTFLYSPSLSLLHCWFDICISYVSIVILMCVWFSV